MVLKISYVIFKTNNSYIFELQLLSKFIFWKNELKTRMYYLRTKLSTDTIKFTINVNINNYENYSGLLFILYIAF
jgi:hypothetical protein